MKTTKLLQLIESYDNGNRSPFWASVKKLSRKDRAQLVQVARSYSAGGTKFAFEVAEKCITGQF